MLQFPVSDRYRPIIASGQFLLQVPPNISSTGQYLLVRFRTDDTINWKGFAAVYIEGGRAYEHSKKVNAVPLPFQN